MLSPPAWPTRRLNCGSSIPSSKQKTLFAPETLLKGATLLLQVREKDPEMYVVPFVLGETALGQQQWEEAATELRKCLELNPHFDQAMLGLGRALIFLGKTDEARQWSKSAIQYNPENYRAWYQLGFIDARTDKKQAIADYEKAVSHPTQFCSPAA